MNVRKDSWRRSTSIIAGCLSNSWKWEQIEKYIFHKQNSGFFKFLNIKCNLLSAQTSWSFWFHIVIWPRLMIIKSIQGVKTASSSLSLTAQSLSLLQIKTVQTHEFTYQFNTYNPPSFVSSYLSCRWQHILRIQIQGLHSL